MFANGPVYGAPCLPGRCAHTHEWQKTSEICRYNQRFRWAVSSADPDDEQILDYLHVLKRKHKTPSDSFFKHTVYGLRYLFRITSAPLG